jgi:hypothetical protein
MLSIGVDAHKRLHVAVALDDAGRVIDQWRGPNSARRIADQVQQPIVVVRCTRKRAGSALTRFCVDSLAVVVDSRRALRRLLPLRGRQKCSHLVVRSLSKVVVPESDCVERLRGDSAHDLVSFVAEFVARLRRAGWDCDHEPCRP